MALNCPVIDTGLPQEIGLCQIDEFVAATRSVSTSSFGCAIATDQDFLSTVIASSVPVARGSEAERTERTTASLAAHEGRALLLFRCHRDE
jgi:hypothetical protein